VTDDFDAFVLARGRALLRFAHVLCGNAHLAEDLVQEVLARAHRRWDRIERMEAPEAYLRRAVVLEFLSWRRRRASTEKLVAEEPEARHEPDPARRVVARAEVRELLASLPRAQRAVLVLRFYAGMADDEIAETLGCAKPTIRAHAARALDTSSPTTVVFPPVAGAARVVCELVLPPPSAGTPVTVGPHAGRILRTAEGVTLLVPLTDPAATLRVRVPAEYAVTDADLVRFAAGIRLTDQAGSPPN
jgi:RNA polymerase sigma-70 factor (sigma-E family)